MKMFIFSLLISVSFLLSATSARALECSAHQGMKMMYDTGQVRPGEGRAQYTCKSTLKKSVDFTQDLEDLEIRGTGICSGTVKCDGVAVWVLCHAEDYAGSWRCPSAEKCFKDSKVFPKGDESKLVGVKKEDAPEAR